MRLSILGLLSCVLPAQGFLGSHCDPQSKLRPAHADAACSSALRMSSKPEHEHGAASTRRGMLNSLSVAATAAAAACAVSITEPAPATAARAMRAKGGPVVTLPSGVSYQEFSEGKGATPSSGDRVAIHYSLFYNGFQVESSRESSGLAALPLGFTYGTREGAGSVPPGLQEGMEGMKVGSRRKITIPPQLAFGEKGRPPFIPPNSEVMFDVSLWSVKPKGTDVNFTVGTKNSIF